MTVIAPGSTVGIFGGGQLGRMMALAARPLGYRVHVLDPDPVCAAAPVVEKVITATFDDVEAARALARGADVVTLEIEKIGLTAMLAAEELSPCRPNATVLRLIQDRAVQKRWLVAQGVPLGPYREAASAAELAMAVTDLGGPCFVKASYGGYDGRGQVELRTAAQAEEAWQSLNASHVVCELALDLTREVSVLVARSATGELAVYPVAENHHENRVLAWSVIAGEEWERPREIARAIAEGLQIVGLVAVEMFVTRSGELLVNELAPRPHNSYHASEMACGTSQFEQAIRAVCGLPLGSVELVRPAAIANILGDAWTHGEPDFAAALRLPGVKLALYGKTPKPGRKMGHLTVAGPDATSRVRQALAALTRGTTR